jgi:hypothetical protein
MDSTTLGTIRNKFLKEVKELEDELKERRDKIKAIDSVLGMLIEAGDKTGNKPGGADTNRFRKMGLQEAILKCMNEPIRWWSILEIKKALVDGGLKTKAKNPYSAITSTLKRLIEKEEVDVEKAGKGRRFKIKDKETSPQGALSESKLGA